jgi:hypothetical protein
LDNSEFNIALMSEKNIKVKLEREKRKSELKLQEAKEIDRLMDENKAQVYFVKTDEYANQER